MSYGTGGYRPGVYGTRPVPPPQADTRSLGMKAVAIIFFVSAALTVGRVTLLKPWLPTEMTPGVAYGLASFQVFLGLALLQGSTIARRFVVVLTWITWALAMVGVFLALAQLPIGVAWVTGLLVTVLILLPVLALTLLLSGDAPSRARVWVCVGVLTVYGLGGFVLEAAGWRLLEGRMRAEIAEWASPDPAYNDAALGIRLAPPEGWTLLKHDNPFVPQGVGKVSLAHLESTAVAVLTMEELRSGPTAADGYLERLLKQRQEREGSTRDVGREDASLGGVPGRRLLTTWRKDGRSYRGFTLAWLDGWRYFALSGWSPEARSEEALRSFAALEKGIGFTPVLSARLGQLHAKAAADSPHLSRAAVEALLGKYPGKDLSSGEMFRLGHYWAVKGLEGMTPAETQEMGDLTTALFGAIPGRERARLGEYLENVRFGRPTSARDDDEMCRVMRIGTQKLPEASRQRLQALLEKAISVAVLLER